MHFEQRLESHFPVHVMVREHRDATALNEALRKTVLALEQRHRGTELDATHMRECTTQGGYQTSGRDNFLDLQDAHVRSLRDTVVKPAVDAYLADALGANPFGVDYRLYSWANVLRTGDWQAPHMHPTEFNVASGVYYVHAPERPEPDGWLEFINPHPISTMHGSTSSRRHAPRSGQLLLFPPWYMHFVHPLRGDGQRVIVAFDVRLKA